MALIEVIEVIEEGPQGPQGPVGDGADDPRIDTIVVAMNTKAAIGNTVITNGVMYVTNLIGTGDSTLPPPIDGQPATGGDYRGYRKVPFSFIKEDGELTVVGGEIIVGAGGAGDYNTPHAWIDMSASTNATVVGYIFAIEKASDGLLYFSDRVVSQRASAQNLVTNISGGGFVSGLEPGDKVSTWVASSITTNVTIYDANIGLKMILPELLRV